MPLELCKGTWGDNVIIGTLCTRNATYHDLKSISYLSSGEINSILQEGTCGYIPLRDIVNTICHFKQKHIRESSCKALISYKVLNKSSDGSNSFQQCSKVKRTPMLIFSVYQS